MTSGTFSATKATSPGLVAVQLGGPQARLVHDVDDALGEGVAEHPDGDDVRRQTPGDVARRPDRHLARRGGEHEPDRVGAHRHGEERVLLVRHPADLHEHATPRDPPHAPASRAARRPRGAGPSAQSNCGDGATQGIPRRRGPHAPAGGTARAMLVRCQQNVSPRPTAARSSSSRTTTTSPTSSICGCATRDSASCRRPRRDAASSSSPKSNPSLVLLDIGLPGPVDGIEVCRDDPPHERGPRRLSHGPRRRGRPRPRTRARRRRLHREAVLPPGTRRPGAGDPAAQLRAPAGRPRARSRSAASPSTRCGAR